MPSNIQFGVDVAIRKLRPGAEFELQGTTITKWIDPENRPAPSWEEISTQFNKDKQAYEEYEATHKEIWQQNFNAQLAEANINQASGPTK
jgi:hypothetical protein